MSKPDSPNYLAIFAFSIVFGLLILLMGWLGGKKSWSDPRKIYTQAVPSKKRS